MIPVITDRARWEIHGRAVIIRLGNIMIARGSLVGNNGAVRLDWRGTYRSLAAAAQARGLTGVESADVCDQCGHPANNRVALCDTCHDSLPIPF